MNFNDTFFQNFLNVNDIAEPTKNVQKDLVSIEEALKRGNAFENLYLPYRKDMFVFTPKNDRERLLLQIMQVCFYAHELNLYLDTHPNDKERINMFVEYNNLARTLIDQYEKKYAPIVLNNNNSNTVPWSWAMSPWPWEGV
jgi:spore coat protein JB